MDANKAGDKYKILFLGHGAEHYGLLSKAAEDQWNSIKRAVHDSWVSGDESTRRHAVQVSGCLDKLGAVLLQVSRIRGHHEKLLNQAKEQKKLGPSMAAYRGDEECADFEALLLQARAALDRLASHTASRFKYRSQSFRKLRPILAALAQADHQAETLHNIVSAGYPWFAGSLGRLENELSLRDLVAHRYSALEGIRTCFAISVLDADRALLFDCEVSFPGQTRRYPIFRTTHEAAKWLPFIILNIIAAFVGVETLDEVQFEPFWSPSTVVFSDFVVDENWRGERYRMSAVQKMTLDGLDLRTENVNAAILQKATVV